MSSYHDIDESVWPNDSSSRLPETRDHDDKLGGRLDVIGDYVAVRRCLAHELCFRNNVRQGPPRRPVPSYRDYWGVGLPP